MPLPVTLDEYGSGTWKALPQVGLYVLFCLSLSLPSQKAYWKKLFEVPAVHNSAVKMLLLKVCFVAQTVLLSALISDIVFQLSRDASAVPQVPGLWLSPVTIIAGTVLSITKSSIAMTNHLMQALSVAAVPSLVSLHCKYSPIPPQSLEANMLWFYAVSLVAVFWQDVKQFILDREISFSSKWFGGSDHKDHSHGTSAPLFGSPGLNHTDLDTPKPRRREERSPGSRSRSKSPADIDDTKAAHITAAPEIEAGIRERRDRVRSRR